VEPGEGQTNPVLRTVAKAERKNKAVLIHRTAFSVFIAKPMKNT
jgi:hypothetical protein